MQTAYIPVPTIPKPMPESAAWSAEEVLKLYDLPFMDLIHRAQQTHRAHFDPNAIQLSSLLSIKTGGCPEDCAYCPQSAHHDTGLEADKLMPLEDVIAAARAAQAGGAQRFCMGAAWRSPKPHHLEAVAEMVSAVKELGMETCVTLGMLAEGQAEQLKHAGLDYYNHNLDTSPEFYGKIISTRTYQDRLDTLERVRDAGINVCCGGIVGMGESRRERAGLIAQLASMEPYPNPCPSTIWCRSKARRWPASKRWIRSNSCAPSPSPGSPCPRPRSGCRPAVSRWTMRCRRCASWPAPTPCSTATRC